MRKVIHLIPYDGIGGVETAARSMVSVAAEDFEFRVETIIQSSAAKGKIVTVNPLRIVAAIFRLWKARPAVLVVSLWRACVVGVTVKLLSKDVRLVVFLHCQRDVHGLDRFFTRLAVRLAYRVWADSQETLRRRVPSLPPGKGRVVSFVTSRLSAPPAQPVRPVFIFWGRIAAEKGLDRAMSIFAEVYARNVMARFLVIGPNGGELTRVQSLADELGLAGAVQFLGGMDFASIKQLSENAAFYLQTSVFEGMGMSVVEAMQLGLVPVVTPVGEIAHYGRHWENALIVKDNAATIEDIMILLEDDARYQAMRQNAVATWADKPLYSNSVLAACREVLGQENTGN